MRKLGFAMTCVILVALVFTASGPFAVQAQSHDPLYGYGVVESSVQNYGDGGWGGWSVPAGKVVTGGGFWLTGGPAAASAPAPPNSTWPHYSYGEDEYGWVVQDAPDGSGSSGSYVYAIYADEPAGYEIVTSSPMGFSSGGWGGWSCPEGKVVLGGGFEADGPVAVSAPGIPGTEYPHYTYGPDEYGWVVQNANEPNTITIYAICADKPAGYEIVESAELDYGDGGWAGWSCPPGKAVTGGGFLLTGGPAAVSAPGTPGSVWPHYTYGQEYGWVVRDAPDGSGSPGSHVYAICASAVIYVDEVNCDPGDEQGTSEKPFCSIQAAIDNAVEGDTIQVAAGTYVEEGQIVIDKDLTIVGNDKETTIIKPAEDTGSSGDARGWFLVEAGNKFNLSNVTLDGEGKQVYQAIRSHGTGTIDGNVIKNIEYPGYMGSGVVAMGGNMTISSNTLAGIGRVGIMAYGSGVDDAQITGNIYTGKGDGDHLDYGVEIGGGANATISENTITGIGDSETEWSSAAILVTDAYPTNGPAEATITHNSLTNNHRAISVGYGEEDGSVVVAQHNDFSGSHQGIRTTAGLVVEVVGTFNWWDAASGPSGEGPGTGAAVWPNVDYSPWCGDLACSFTVSEGDDGQIVVPAGTDASEIQQIIDDAPYGAVIVLPPETIEGSFTIATPGITIVLSDGTVIQPTSPCIVVAADDTTITSESFPDGVCKPSGSSPGIDVSAAVSNLVIKGVEIDGSSTTGDGILIDAAVANLQILDNYIHSCASGIRYTDNGEVSGVHEVQGNLFMGNDYGVQNESGQTYDVRYNSWGAQDGPDGEGDGSGDDVSANLDFEPWTHVAVFMTSSGTPQDDEIAVGYQITYTIQMDAHEVQGADFQLSFDNSALKVVSISDGGLFPLEASLTTVADANTHGIISFHGGRGLEGTLSGAAQEMYTVVFEAQSADDSPVALELGQASFAMAPGYGGSNNIYPSELVDGAVIIHPATTVTGRIDLQGRADNSGAVMTSLEGPALGYGPFEFDASSYWGDISVDGVAYEDTYAVTVDKYRYLNVTADSGKSVTVDTDPQELATLVLFGGDANSDDKIDIGDATIIGGAYGTVSGEGGWDERADINADGVIDILDLALMGGNFDKTSETAYAAWTP